MLTNLAKALIAHKRIKTTVAKAKALRKFVEPILTKAKKDTTHSRRVVFSYFQDKEPVKELFDNIAGKIADRPGGYTRIIRLGNRLGDNAEMCMMELVDYNNLLQKEPRRAKTKAKTRRGRGKAKAIDSAIESPSKDQVINPELVSTSETDARPNIEDGELATATTFEKAEDGEITAEAALEANTGDDDLPVDTALEANTVDSEVEEDTTSEHEGTKDSSSTTAEETPKAD